MENMSDISINLLKNREKTIAEFDQAMLGFTHPVAYRIHRWNLAETGQHLDKISLVDGAEKRALLQWGFDQWIRV